MTALVGMRALGANANNVQHGIFTEQPGTLTPDFFVNHAQHGYSVEEGERIAWRL